MILVTGATGCIGSNLTRELVHRGEDVAILERPGDDVAAIADLTGEVRRRVGDVRDAEAVDRAMQGVERVYHLAGITAPLNALAPLMQEVNVGGTENVMAAALRQGARVVHTSSIAAVGFPDEGTVADETFPFNGAEFCHAYMTTKQLAEQVVHRHVASGLDAVIVNPAATMAPGGDLRIGWANLLVRLHSRRMPAFPRGGLAMVTGRDVVAGHIRAMEVGARGERYILNTVNLRYRRLIELAASVLSVPPARVPIPNPAIKVAARVVAAFGRLVRNPFERSPLAPENVPLLTRVMYYDNAKARSELGLTPTSLRDAIEDVAEWCRRKGALR
ncbi:MAG TPA: SDR family NAD(P)-dependent oxidoreductase [Thermoleophilaceae bacterium]